MIADKYNLEELFEVTGKSILNTLTENNFFERLDWILKFDNKKLSDEVSFQVKNMNMKKLCLDSFQQVSRGLIELILKQDELSVDESGLFHACVKWAQAECGRNLIENPTTDDIRQTLGELLFLFRISSFTVKQFIKGPGQYNLYTDQMTIDILFYIGSNYKCTRSGLQMFSSLEPREYFFWSAMIDLCLQKFVFSSFFI